MPCPELWQLFTQKLGIECCFPCLYFSRTQIVRHSLKQIPYPTRKQSAETIDHLHVYPVGRLVVEQGNRVAVQARFTGNVSNLE